LAELAAATVGTVPAVFEPLAGFARPVLVGVACLPGAAARALAAGLPLLAAGLFRERAFELAIGFGLQCCDRS
jgi:hypothetical protein